MKPGWWLAAAAGAAAALALALPGGALALPIYWDAAAVYAPGARWLADHGFDVRPGAFPADLSKGHPALFFVVVGAAFRAFGATPLVGHAVAAAASAATLVFTVAVGAQLGSALAGALAAALLVSSPLYLSMSAQVIPELTVAALVMAALYFHLRGRMYIVAALGVAMVLCKETALAFPLALGGLAALEALRQRRLPAPRALLPAVAPVAALGAFFAWQRAAEGWFIMPSQADLVVPHVQWSSVVDLLGSLATHHGRGLALGAAAAGLVVLARRRALPWATPGGRALHVAGGLFALAFLVFFARALWLRRYALAAHPPFCLMLTLPIALGARALVADRRLGAALACAPVVAAAAVGLGARWDGREVASGEDTLRYAEVIRERRALYAALQGDPYVVTAWPMDDELREPWLGWVPRPFRARSLDGHRRRGGPPPDAVIVLGGCCQDGALRGLARGAGLGLRVRRERDGIVHELWAR